MPSDVDNNGFSSSPSVPSNPATAAGPRKHGSLIDVITLAQFPFQFEPFTHKDKCTTHFGEKLIVGQRTAGFHWVGGGKDDVELDIYLVGAAYTNPGTPTPGDIGAVRAGALSGYSYWLQVPTGGVNPDGSPQMTMVKNLQPPPALSDSDAAKNRITADRVSANNAVLNQIAAFKGLIRPQDDIGAPHPLFINIGGLYTGIQFLLEDLEVTYISRNLDSLVPYEASIKLKLAALGDATKYSGSGAKK